jgi:hypothetical protein
MKLSGFAPILSSLMTDQMDIFRHDTTENEDGTTKTELPSTPLSENIRCRVSFFTSDNPRDMNIDENPVIMSPTIFCDADTDILPGDIVTVRRMQDDGTVAQTINGRVGFPKFYPSHKEVPLSIDTSA